MTKIIKATLRIPAEQYAYIEVEVADKKIENIIETYRQFTAQVKKVDGLPDAQFNECVDRFLTDGEHLHSEEYADMSWEQKNIIQTIKRAIKRLNYKTKEER